MTMEKKLQKYLDEAFAPYGNFPAREDVKQEMSANLQEKYADLKAEGKTDDEAYQATIDSVGDIAEIMEHVPHDGQSGSEGVAHGASENTSASRQFRSLSMPHSDLSGTSLQSAD